MTYRQHAHGLFNVTSFPHLSGIGQHFQCSVDMLIVNVGMTFVSISIQGHFPGREEARFESPQGRVCRSEHPALLERLQGETNLCQQAV